MRGHLRKRVEMRKMRRFRREESLRIYVKPTRRRLFIKSKKFTSSKRVRWHIIPRLSNRFSSKFYLRKFNSFLPERNITNLNTARFRRRGNVFINKALFTIKKKRVRWIRLWSDRDDEDDDDDTKSAPDNDPEKSVANTAIILDDFDSKNELECTGELFSSDFESTQSYYLPRYEDLLLDFSDSEDFSEDSSDDETTDTESESTNIAVISKDIDGGISSVGDSKYFDNFSENIAYIQNAEYAPACGLKQEKSYDFDIILPAGAENELYYEIAACSDSDDKIEDHSDLQQENEPDSSSEMSDEDSSKVDSSDKSSDDSDSDDETFESRLQRFEAVRVNGTFLNEECSGLFEDKAADFNNLSSELENSNYQYSTVSDYSRFVKRTYRLRNNLSYKYKMLGNVSRVLVHINEFSKNNSNELLFDNAAYYAASRFYDSVYTSYADFFKKIELFRCRKKTKNALKKISRLRSGRKFTKRLRKYRRKNIMSILPRWGRFVFLGKQANDLTTLSNTGGAIAVVPEAMYTSTYWNFLWRDFFDSEDSGKIQFVVRHASFILKGPHFNNNMLFRSFFYFETRDPISSKKFFKSYFKDLMLKTKTLKISKKKNMPHVLLGVVSRFWDFTIQDSGLPNDTIIVNSLTENASVYTMHCIVEVYKVLVLLLTKNL